MKYYKVLVFSLLFSGVFGQPYTIEVTIKYWGKSPLRLYALRGDSKDFIDSARTDTAGYAKFTIKEKLSSGLYRIHYTAQQYFNLIINNESSVVLKTHPMDVIDSMRVINSLENEIYFDFMQHEWKYQHKINLLNPLLDHYPEDGKFMDEVVKKYESLQKEHQKFCNDKLKRYPDTYAAKIIKAHCFPAVDPELGGAERNAFMKEHFFDMLDMTDKGLLNSNVYNELAISYISYYRDDNLNKKQQEEQFIIAVRRILDRARENTAVYEFLFDYLFKGFDHFNYTGVLEYMVEHLNPEETCQNEDRKTTIQKRIDHYKKMATGKTAPEIIIPDTNNQEVVYTDFSTEYTLVIFWSTSCPHCTSTLPKIKEYLGKMNEPDIQVLAISLDTSRSDWMEYIRKENLTSWFHGSELAGWDSYMADAYNIYATPTMFILDNKRKILSKPVSFNELKDSLEELQ